MKTHWKKMIGWYFIAFSVAGIGDFVFFDKSIYIPILFLFLGICCLIRQQQERRGK